ncbi:MAG: VanW family protein [bacterium]|nr:VanW family protein [bacterium]
MNFLPRLAHARHAIKIGVAIFFAVLAVTTAGSLVLMYGYNHYYTGRVLPGVSVADMALDGMTESQAQESIHQAVTQATADGLRFKFESDTIILPLVNNDKGFIRFDETEALATALHYGQSEAWWKDGWQRIRLRFHRVNLGIPTRVDEPAIEQNLQQQLATRLTSVQNAALHVTMGPDGKSPTSTVTEAVSGKSVDLPTVLKDVQIRARKLDFSPIVIPVMVVQPQWTAADIEGLASDIPAFLAHTPFILNAERQHYTVTPTTLASWITVIKSENGSTLGIDTAKMTDTLRSFVAPYVDEAADGSLEMKDHKIFSFVAPSNGVRFDAEKTAENILAAFAKNATSTNLELPTVTAHILGPDAERLGLKELLGVGRSSFGGSPSNRRKNIALGAEKVNRVLLAPGEEFSMLKTLGVIDGGHGWLPELVIKGNKTVPEFGGGLCQIGTTMFRTALAAGMPITQRQNHSYRVSYYEPAGTDATIYDPAPDFRFKNDTTNWLLITTRVKGDDLAFSVWGTDDGRLIEQTDPKVYNIVPAPLKKIVETTTLPVGTTKCTETAHAGADAKFDYTVTYADGRSEKTTFLSHYKPWGAVCLVGVASLENSTNSSEKIDQTGVNNPN